MSLKLVLIHPQRVNNAETIFKAFSDELKLLIIPNTPLVIKSAKIILSTRNS